MSYLVLARKYRPQNFSDIVGQDHITNTIKNALKSNKIWHAYIFAGMRGTGKTTTARVLAKALNCTSPTENFEPCNKCTNCIEITQGSSVDVIEIDAASNRGIDDIRALRETVKYVPANSKYKVYIIDEAHQITDAAFNAFLKTLEEPPNYVVFILATTEFNALPLTIVSRCQVFRFRPVSSTVLFERLKYILNQENKQNKITDDGLKLIVEASNGSVRDALSLLDQVLSYTETNNILDADLVREIFGNTPTEIISKYTNLILESDLKQILDYINEIYFSGVDFLQFSKDLLEFFRTILHIKYSGSSDSTYLTLAKNFENKFTSTHLIAYIQQLLRLVEEIKRTDYPKILFELYTIKLTNQYKDINEIIDNLEKSVVETQTKTTFVETSDESLTFKPTQQPNITDVIQPNLQKVSKEDIYNLWDKVLEIIKNEKPLSYAVISSSEVSFENGSFIIYLPNKYTKVTLETQKLDIAKILKTLTGKEVKVSYEIKHNNKLVFGESLPEQTVTNKNVVTIKPKKQTTDPVVEKIRTAFHGKIVEKHKTEEKTLDGTNGEQQ